jgi:hypothetical protein
MTIIAGANSFAQDPIGMQDMNNSIGSKKMEAREPSPCFRPILPANSIAERRKAE